MAIRDFFIKLVTPALWIFFLILPASAARQVVTSPADSVAGSLRTVIDLAAAGDTVLFDIPGTDTVFLKNNITIKKDIVILGGANLATKNRIVVTVDTQNVPRTALFYFSEAKFVVRGMVMNGRYSTRRDVLSVRAKKVVLDSVVICNGNSGG